MENVYWKISSFLISLRVEAQYKPKLVFLVIPMILVNIFGLVFIPEGFMGFEHIKIFFAGVLILALGDLWILIYEDNPLVQFGAKIERLIGAGIAFAAIVHNFIQ